MPRITVRDRDTNFDRSTLIETNTSRNKSNPDGTFGDKIPLKFDPKDPARPYYAANAKSSAGGNIDLINDAAWTVSPPKSREGILPLVITEFQPKYSSLITDLFAKVNALLQFQGKSFDELTEGFIANPIAHSFLANKTNLSYTLPYLQMQTQDFNTQFGDGDNPQQNVLQQAVGFIKEGLTRNSAFNSILGPTVGKFAKGFAGASVLPQLIKDAGRSLYPAVDAASPQGKYYSGSSPTGYDITFELLNTIDHEKSKLHKELVELWSHQMSANLRNPIIGDSPTIYTVEFFGLRWCPAAHLNFSYVGNGNLVYIDGEPYPESYTCTFKVEEIFPTIRTILHQYIKNGTKFHAINTDPKALCNTLNRGIGAVRNLF